MENELLFYDIEVFTNDSMVVFLDINKEVQAIYHNDFDGLADFVTGKTLIGYNNNFYDNHILKYMIDQKPQKQIKRLNDRIISGERVKTYNLPFDSLDCFQQIDVSMPSLKKIEGNLGKMILESAIPFDLDRSLTENEVQETIDYCTYDVAMTVDVYKMRIDSYFKPKEYLVSMMDEDLQDKSKNWNTTTISANLLLDNPLTKWAWIKVPEDLLSLVPEDVSEMWRTKSKGKKTIRDFDCDIEFGFGGLHGTHKHIKKAENVKLLDVASMYPNIIRNLSDENILKEGTKTYSKMIDRRVKIKHEDKVQADALKLILNSVYGNLKNQYSLLHNPKASTTVCAYGQIVLYELCRRLSASCTLININTDGVAFIPENNEYKKVWEQWEKDFNLTLEEDEFDVFWQRDVNNYVAKNGSKITVKGGDVNRYHQDSIFRNNNARILDIALVDKLLFDKDVIDTLTENTDKPYLYQYILQAGNTYQGTFDDDDNRYNKINRVFAAKKGDFRLYKKRQDDGLVRFPDAPESMLLWNDDCEKMDNFSSYLDINHYYSLLQKRLERWV